MNKWLTKINRNGFVGGLVFGYFYSNGILSGRKLERTKRKQARSTAPRCIKKLVFDQLFVSWSSQRRGSGRSVIDDIDFPMAILAYFFSRRSLVSKQRHCHIRQTICSTRFGVRVCLLVVWCKNFQPPFYRLPKFKMFDCKMRFFVKITHLL